MQSYKIIVPNSKEELEAYYRLRYEVLRKPWGQAENTNRDEWEEVSLHALMLDEHGRAVATGRLQFNSPSQGQIRSMAVDEALRGSGLGTVMLKYLEEQAREKKLFEIILDARDHAADFYRKNGYEVIGDSYTLFGTIPHFRMRKKL